LKYLIADSLLGLLAVKKKYLIHILNNILTMKLHQFWKWKKKMTKQQ